MVDVEGNLGFLECGWEIKCGVLLTSWLRRLRGYKMRIKELRVKTQACLHQRHSVAEKRNFKKKSEDF